MDITGGMLKVLAQLYVHADASAWAADGGKLPVWAEQAITKLAEEELVGGTSCWAQLTPRGYALVRAMMGLPLPEQVWQVPSK